MDIKGLRTLNLIGTILFAIIGTLLVLVYYLELSTAYILYSESEYSVCMTFLIIWYSIIFIFTLLFYKYTVIGLDRGNYKTAKLWTLIGIIVGFAGGIIPLIIFIISYVSFDDAIKTQQYGHMQYGYPQQPIPIRNCNNCKRQIPPDSRLCPYCGAHQDLINQTSKKLPPPPRSKKSIPGQNQDHKPLPPPPKRYKKEK